MDLTSYNLESLGSPYAKQLKLGFGNLRFAGMLEKEFRDDFVEQSLIRGRISALLALGMILALSFIDLLFGAAPGTKLLNILRLGVLCPVIAVIVAATMHGALRKHYTLVASIGISLVGLVVEYMSMVAANAGASYVLAGVALVVLAACLFLGLLFYIAVALSAMLVLAYLVMGFAMDMPSNQVLYSTAILATAAVIGALSAYNLEYALRTSYLETRILNELAERDGLTGLYNRRIFDDFIRRVWRQARREDIVLQIIFVDIDYFKIYNDLYGHQAGDDCLRKAAECIARATKRPFDFCARYGGEEFVLVLYGPPRDYARTVPEQIRRDVIALGIPHEGSEIENLVTVSVGVAVTQPGRGRSLAGAIQTADEALYEAKQNGRNRVLYKDADACEVETGNFRVHARMKA
jgi:diguanylate cyclase (GGDEF)-like protein